MEKKRKKNRKTKQKKSDSSTSTLSMLRDGSYSLSTGEQKHNTVHCIVGNKAFDSSFIPKLISINVSIHCRLSKTNDHYRNSSSIKATDSNNNPIKIKILMRKTDQNFNLIQFEI